VSKLELKYFRKIDAAEQEHAAAQPAPLPPFDITPFLTRSRVRQRISRFLFRSLMPAIFFLLRAFWPVARIGRLVIVSRDAQVRHVLDSADDFQVPFGPEMRAAGGANSVLGTEAAEHDRVRDILRGALRQDDLENIRIWSRGYADALLEGSAGTIDVITDLFTRVATETCARYFGLTIHDPNAFAHWTMAVSSQLFADPFGDPKARALALNGAVRVRAVIEDAIARVRSNHAAFGAKKEARNVIDRLIQAGLSDGEIVSNIMGLATGFIPTNTLAAGNMLEELLSNRGLLDQAVQAAQVAGDPEYKALRAILLTAGRRNPALSPGQWRIVVRDAAIPVGRRRTKTIRRAADERKPVVVLAGVMSALRDRRSPANRSPEPEAAADLLFGWGPHSCLGRYVAMEQIVQSFAALLSQPRLRVARGKHGWMQRMGPFPIRLDMSFHSMASTQTMIIVSARVTDGTPLEAIRAEIEALGNPAVKKVQDSLTATDIVHFASLNAISSGHTEGSYPIVLLELNVDGPRPQALAQIAERAFDWLAPIMRHCAASGERLESHRQLAALLGRHALDLHCKPWGPIGIHYNGTPEFSVRDIARQARLAGFARQALDHHFKRTIGRGRAMQALTEVRRFIRQDSFYKLKTSSLWPTLAEGGKASEFEIVRPSRKRLAMADWQPPKSIWEPFGSLVAAPEGRRILAWFGGFALLAAIAVGLIFDPSRFAADAGIGAIARGVGLVFLAAVAGILLTLLLTAAVVAVLALILAAKERRDPIDERHPEYDHVRRLEARENEPGYEHNHIIAVMPLKPGAFRKLVFAFALWGIKQAIRHWFRPGFVVTMGTIHYAKWFRVPGTGQFVFLSNYDGNWESYLEDFITRAHWGQTAAWSNGVGFPRTRFLVFDGAKDGDRFKRWVRRQQQETLCWYSRFPSLTTKQIRNNAMIEEGLAHASTDTDARRWLGCFGSAQREDHEIETSEVQSIVFSGFGHLKHATCLLLRLPNDSPQRSLWLRLVSGEEVVPGAKSGHGLVPAIKLGINLSPYLNENGRAYRELRIAFGDNPPSDGASVLGLTARGLYRLGLGERNGTGGLSRFPTAFNSGMAERGRTLGDLGPNAATNFRWSDAYEAGAVDAALIVYGHKESDGLTGSHDELVAHHRELIEGLGGAVLEAVPTQPLMVAGEARLDVEHFGFRDGISQPVIRATQRAALGVPSRDLCEAGEFILGYRNNQGFHTPAISVAEEDDYRNDLPVLNSAAAGRFPRFGGGLPGENGRDFGRNGTFMVIRQLDQHVDKFNAAIERHAQSVNDQYGEIDAALGHKVGPEWIAAKMIGRWRDGRPLIGNPPEPNALMDPGPNPKPKEALPSPGTGAEIELDNDFTYGSDDPRGFQCPLGAHIRRANPRDSLEPGDEREQFITNRHRLLRRGRSYCYDPDGTGETKGLLFVALCADLERQFEFVQHTWLNSSTFHGLTNEIDPIAGSGSHEPGQPARTFTIPTAMGPITLEDVSSYITARGGGYFFVPSLAALKFLAAGAGKAKQAPDPAMLAAAATPPGASPASVPEPIRTAELGTPLE
jgi:Dyp-type peroxidase family